MKLELLLRKSWEGPAYWSKSKAESAILYALTSHLDCSNPSKHFVAFQWLLYNFFHGSCSDELYTLITSLHEFNDSARLAFTTNNVFVGITIYKNKFNITSFSSFHSHTCPYLNEFCLHINNDLQICKWNVNRYDFFHGFLFFYLFFFCFTFFPQR